MSSILCSYLLMIGIIMQSFAKMFLMKSIETPVIHPFVLGMPLLMGILMSTIGIFSLLFGSAEYFIFGISAIGIIIAMSMIVGLCKALWDIRDYTKAFDEFSAAYLSFEDLYRFVSDSDRNRDHLDNLYTASQDLLLQHAVWQRGEEKKEHWEITLELEQLAQQLRYGHRIMEQPSYR